jgi:hypothetical protein
VNDTVLGVTLEWKPGELTRRDMGKRKVRVSGQQASSSLAGEAPSPNERHTLGLGRCLGSVAARRARHVGSTGPSRVGSHTIGGGCGGPMWWGRRTNGKVSPWDATLLLEPFDDTLDLLHILYTIPEQVRPARVKLPSARSKCQPRFSSSARASQNSLR